MNEKTAGRPAWMQGSNDLSGRTVLVVGGTGGVGEGVVRALLDDGAQVLATGRDPAKLEALASHVASAGLHVEQLDALSDDLPARATALQQTYGPFDGVVVSVASWGEQGRKPVLALTDAEWEALVDANQTAVFRLYRAFVPLIAPGGVLLQLNGMSADIPFPGNAAVALTAAATKSLTRTLAAELAGRGPRVYEVVLGVIRTRPRREAGIDDPRWIPATDIGVHVAELVGGTSPLTTTTLHYFLDATAGPQAGDDGR
jgi:NAD(P)-dependent dehydrogenase (short-subunit alcohol dehydrogenase family)